MCEYINLNIEYYYKQGKIQPQSNNKQINNLRDNKKQKSINKIWQDNITNNQKIKIKQKNRMQTPKTRAQLSRASYRQYQAYKKTRQQKTKPTYLQNKIKQQINNSNSGYLQKLQKQLHIYHPLYNPQARFTEYQLNNQSNTNTLDQNSIGVNQNKSLIAQGQLGRKNIQQLDNSDQYQVQFLQKNYQRNSDNKVQRQKINIQFDNYKAIMNSCLKNIKDTAGQFMQCIKQLQDKFKQGHLIFTQLSHQMEQKRSKQKSRNKSIINLQIKLQNLKSRSQALKSQQYDLQNNLLKIFIRLRTLIRNRNNFIKFIFSKGYYQQNGLIWILQQLIKIEQFDEQIRPKFIEQCQKVGLKAYSNLFSSQNEDIGINSLKNYMPNILDDKSKQYLAKVYHRMKQGKKKQLKQQNHIRQRIKTNMQKSEKKQYILDVESQIFPNSLTNRQPTKSQQSNSNDQLKDNSQQVNLHTDQSEKKENLSSLKSSPSFLVSRNQDNILQKSNIIGLYKDVQAHTRNQKYNYDIKNIYANTRQSLLKWIKGKCKDVVLNKQSPEKSKQKVINLQNQPQKIEKLQRVQTQKSSAFIRYSRARSKKSLNFLQQQIKKPETNFNSPIYLNYRSKSKIFKNINDDNQQQMKVGFSLPLIAQKKSQIRKLSQKDRMPKQLNSATKSAIKKLQKSFTLPLSQEIKTNSVQAIIKYKNQLNRKQQNIMSEGLPQKAQQVRILRIYKKQHQQTALKYLFGIKIKKQTLIRMLFYQ